MMLYPSANNRITNQRQEERLLVDRTFGRDCPIKSTRYYSYDRRITHPQLCRLCNGGLLSGDLIRTIMDIQNQTCPIMCFHHIRPVSHTFQYSANWLAAFTTMQTFTGVSPLSSTKETQFTSPIWTLSTIHLQHWTMTSTNSLPEPPTLTIYFLAAPHASSSTISTYHINPITMTAESLYWHINALLNLGYVLICRPATRS